MIESFGIMILLTVSEFHESFITVSMVGLKCRVLAIQKLVLSSIIASEVDACKRKT